MMFLLLKGKVDQLSTGPQCQLQPEDLFMMPPFAAMQTLVELSAWTDLLITTASVLVQKKEQ